VGGGIVERVAPLSARERAGLPDRAFAYVDSAGRRRLPIHDEAHVRNALARFGRVRFESDEARDLARQRLLNAAKRLGIMPVGFLTSQLRSAGRGPALPTGSVTFLLTDIEGSTVLLSELEEGYAQVLRDVRELIGAAVRANRGTRVDAHGDEYFAVFERPESAVQAAVDVQRAMAAHEWPGGRTVRVRAGVHGGRPELTEAGYVGLSVHTVARICSVAHGGQILVSGQTRDAMTATPAALRLAARGAHRLAGLPGPHELFQVVTEGLATDFPPLRIPR